MTIRKGEGWGSAAPLPDDGVLVRSDAEARTLVETARRAGSPPPVLGLLGGDLCKTLGGRGDESRLRSEQAMTFQVDLGSVLADGRLHWFVAHLIAHRRWWRGRAVAVMNAQWLGSWDLGPRSHPNDGLLDVSEGALPLGDLLKARRRATTGTHIPHPAITTRRVNAWQTELDPPTPVWLDGVALGSVRNLSVRVEPDALTVVV